MMLSKGKTEICEANILTKLILKNKEDIHIPGLQLSGRSKIIRNSAHLSKYENFSD